MRVAQRLFVNELYDRCKELGSLHHAFSLVPRLEQTGIRRRPYGNYLIFYRVSGDTVEILHVLHGAMDY
ncbi:type II toxin-antitoxin system RelE/ParE family toxin, partial [Rhizobiaceae sp. 2RAB30]